MSGLVPYVSTTLRTVWLPAVWPTLDYVYSTAGDKTQPPVPHYRVTPDVYAWLRRQVGIADDKAYVAVKAATTDRDSLLSDTGVLVEQVRVLAERWIPVADWAEQVYTADERAAAVPRLPAVGVRLRDVPAMP